MPGGTHPEVVYSPDASEEPVATLHRGDYFGLMNIHVFARPHCRVALGVATEVK